MSRIIETPKSNDSLELLLSRANAVLDKATLDPVRTHNENWSVLVRLLLITVDRINRCTQDQDDEYSIFFEKELEKINKLALEFGY